MSDQPTRAELLELYAGGYQTVLAALDGVSGSEWDFREAPGEWSVREIVHHLGESEMNAAAGFRMLITGSQPTLMDYDPRAWIEILDATLRPIEPSLAAFRYARETTLPLLNSLSEEQWAATGMYSDGTPLTTGVLLDWYGPHAHDHADQIRRARAAAQS